MSEEFFERHVSVVDWIGLLINFNVSLQFITKYCSLREDNYYTGLYKVNLQEFRDKYKNNLWMKLIVG